MKIKGIPSFSTNKDKFDWLIKKKSFLFSTKKSATVTKDAIGSLSYAFLDSDDFAIKASPKEFKEIVRDAKQIKVRALINTTKLFDSHGDVHIDQLWNKSLSQTKNFYLLKEHVFSFNSIITDNVKAFTKQLEWKTDLGINYEGKTQGLIFDATIDKPDESTKYPNEQTVNEMFNMYISGKVKQHSIGMQYVKMDMAINDNRYEKEFSVWEKYFDQIANKEDALEAGYFFPITEAKIIEGSAVPKGSNWATPTMSVQQTKGEPEESIRTQPIKVTAEQLLNMYVLK
jgi:hypothetical protein